MRECWINVSVVRFRGGPEAVLGSAWGTRELAVRVHEYAQYRLHVRLKPEPEFVITTTKAEFSERMRREPETSEERWNRIEDEAIDLIDSGDPLAVQRGHMRLRMVEAARLKALR